VRLATIRTGAGLRAVRLDGDVLVDVGAPDVGALLGHADWAGRVRAAMAGPAAATYAVGGADYAPVVLRPSRVICVGLNYRSHILEMGRPLPEHPTLFAKFADALIGARDDIARLEETSELDWEAELALVVGFPVRRARGAAAAQAIAGFTILNDITCRD
jgi:acylpyruvate hydrolase